MSRSRDASGIAPVWRSVAGLSRLRDSVATRASRISRILAWAGSC
ncbi:hypothetical protein DB32_002157 [Sandaracinus amylolyticus]|uniref:Uncharacterized protein n=1 Tax=Sandaracinus amylolyticus TaxID=927083 RepID=A0A0F6W1Q0_9BACT|nr:hypothetical protein DB32_002157 [Sandaracinus amylolyticus]